MDASRCSRTPMFRTVITDRSGLPHTALNNIVENTITAEFSSYNKQTCDYESTQGHNDSKIHTNRHFLNNFFGTGTWKRIFLLKTQHRILYDHNTFSTCSIGEKLNKVLRRVLSPRSLNINSTHFVLHWFISSPCCQSVLHVAYVTSQYTSFFK